MKMEEMPEACCDFKVSGENEKRLLIPKRYHLQKAKDAVALSPVFPESILLPIRSHQRTLTSVDGIALSVQISESERGRKMEDSRFHRPEYRTIIQNTFACL